MCQLFSVWSILRNKLNLYMSDSGHTAAQPTPPHSRGQVHVTGRSHAVHLHLLKGRDTRRAQALLPLLPSLLLQLPVAWRQLPGQAQASQVHKPLSSKVVKDARTGIRRARARRRSWPAADSCGCTEQAACCWRLAIGWGRLSWQPPCPLLLLLVLMCRSSACTTVKGSRP